MMRLLTLAITCALTACATPAMRGPDPDAPRAAELTLSVVRKSPVQRFVREAPAVVRSGVARLVTMVPLDDAKVARLAPAIAHAFFVERLEAETALRLEQKLDAAAIGALAAALDRPAVAAVVVGAVAQEPENQALERFVEDPKALPEPRRAKVKALVDASWSPSVIDRMTRAPVAAAGRVVAAAVRDDDAARRSELLRIAESGRPTDPDALVVAFAFLWRDVEDAALDEAAAFFLSAEGKRAHDALVDAAMEAIAHLALQVERDVAGR